MENLAEYILKMRAIGLNGVEVYNNRQDETQEKFLLAFAKRNNLMISGGSDFHSKIGDNESKTIGSVLNKDIDGKMLSKELFDKVF
jgi:predicted metal-dependent phosphoesterase TrpH